MERSKGIYLYLLEFTYAAKDQKTVEEWLAQANLRGVLISTEQYNDEILAVLANGQAMIEEYLQLHRHPAISSCVEKYRSVYRISTTTEPKLVFSSFPLGEGEEWYLGTERRVYLCVQSRRPSNEQICWLNNNKDIIAWQDHFDLFS